MEEEDKRLWKSFRNQILASIAVSLLSVHLGVCMAFATIVLPPEMLIDTIHMGDDNSTFEAAMYETNSTEDALLVDKDQASWIGAIVVIFGVGVGVNQASLVAITSSVGAILAGMLMDRWGRKFTSLLTAAVYLVGWCVTVAVKTNIEVLYIARALAGLAEGLCIVGVVYVSEVTHTSVRSMLLPLGSVFTSLGILLTTVLGYFLTWRGVASFCVGLAFFIVIALIFLPETPIWLSLHVDDEEKRNKKLSQSLRWLYRDSKVYEEEYNRLQAPKQIELVEVTPDSRGQVEEPKPVEEERKVKLWKPVILLCILFFLQQFSGGFVVIFYSLQIFQASGSINMDGWTCLMILGAIRLVMAIFSSFQYFGRRGLMLTSALGMAVSILVASFWLHFFEPSLTPVICVLLYVTFSAYGVLVIPWTLVSELLPSKYRGSCSGYIFGYLHFLMFICIKMFIEVLDTIGMSNVFLIFGVFSAAIFVFVYFFIPETLGKSLEEIQDEL